MKGFEWALVLKPLLAILILGAALLLTRSIEWIEDRFPEGRLKRLIFFKVGDGDLTDPPDDPGRRARMRARQQLPPSD